MSGGRLLTLMLCVNDYRNGAFTGLCSAVSVDEMVHLESPWVDRHLKCEIGARSFRLGKERTFEHRGHGEWVGNWCWDGVLVTPAVAADVVNWVVSKGYRPESGLEALFEKTSSGSPVTAGDLGGP